MPRALAFAAGRAFTLIVIGKQINGYRVVAALGEGGMGAVYRGEVTDPATGLDLGTHVALKVIHPNLLSQEGILERFQREARVGMQVQHENVVRTYGCDVDRIDGEDHHFLAMEYVEGQTLRDLLQELAVVPEELCRHIAAEVTKGLEAIHAVGVVHRDLKPENVLITGEHVVKVMDLGVAHLAEDALQLTQTGMFVGSFEYAAPEQIDVPDEPLDGRVDLFALGLVLYELSTGKHPFRGGNAMETLRKVMIDEPRNVGDLNPQLSAYFEELVRALLVKDRAARFPAASQVLEVLEGGEDGAWWRERARAIQSKSKRPLRRVRIPRETALYGRDAELATLRALYDKSSAGEGQVVVVGGEAGIGKSRLVDEFVGQLRESGEDINFLYGSYPPGGAATAAGAFATAYREQFGGEGLEETLQGYLVETPRLIPAFAALLRGDAPPPGVDPLSADSLKSSFVHATQALSAERPTIILIDDLHFAPDEGRALFASLAVSIRTRPVLLVGTSRPGLPEGFVAELERFGHTARLELPRLGPKDLMALLESAFQSESLAQKLAGQIAQKSDGNPFFAFEIIRSLREGQLITQAQDGTWRSSASVIEMIQIPSSVSDLVQARLRDLTDEERELLEVAACCGFEFDPGLVAAALDMRRLPALKRMGRIEQSHQLVRSAGRQYRFDHHQIQEALYASLHEQMREEYHLAIADAIEEREDAAAREPSALDGALCVQLSEHHLAGGSGKRALRYMDEALKHLDASHGYDRAIQLCERALSVRGLLEGTKRVDTLLRLNDQLDKRGVREPQEALLDEALDLAHGLESDADEARVRNARGLLLVSTSRVEAAKVEFEAARELAASAGDVDAQGKAAHGLGRVLETLGQHEAAYTQFEEARSHALALDDLHEELMAVNGCSAVRFAQGRTEESLRGFEKAVEFARTLDSRLLEMAFTINMCITLTRMGRSGEVVQPLERVLEMSHASGDRNVQISASGALATALAHLGRSEPALRAYRRAIDINRELGNRRSEARFLLGLGGIHVALGDASEAMAQSQEALTIGRQIGDRPLTAAALQQLAVVQAAQGLPAEAVATYREALAIRTEVAARDEDAAQTHLGYGEHLLRTRKPDEARVPLAEAAAVAAEVGAHAPHISALLYLATLGEGDASDALALLNQHETLIPLRSRMRARFLLYELTGELEHLRVAHDLLAEWVENAPAADRDATLSAVALHRDIERAWDAHGEAS